MRYQLVKPTHSSGKKTAMGIETPKSFISKYSLGCFYVSAYNILIFLFFLLMTFPFIKMYDTPSKILLEFTLLVFFSPTMINMSLPFENNSSKSCETFQCLMVLSLVQSSISYLGFAYCYT